MHGLLKRPGYRLYPPDSPEARVLLAEQGLSPTDLDRALAELERTEGTTVRTIVGINEDGVFGTSRQGWHPGLPDAGHEPLIPLLGQGPRAAGQSARGQHRAIPQGRHAAGRCPAPRPPDRQLRVAIPKH